MRVGNVILFLLLALVGFGFCLAYSINLSKELIETRNQLAQVQAEQQTLEVQYQALVEEKNQLTDQVAGLTNENENLRARVKTLEAKRQALTDQIETLQKQLNLVQQTNPILNWLDSAPMERLAAALLVVPVLPLSLGAIYIMTHSNMMHVPTPTNGSIQDATTFRVALTREEFHLITRHRRSRQADKRVE